jgi:hypothetical protein
MTQSNDLPSRMNRAEDAIIDLRLATSNLIEAVNKNSSDIAILAEAMRRNSEETRRNSENVSTMQQSFEIVLAEMREDRRRSDERFTQLLQAIQLRPE